MKNSHEYIYIQASFYYYVLCCFCISLSSSCASSYILTYFKLSHDFQWNLFFLLIVVVVLLSKKKVHEYHVIVHFFFCFLETIKKKFVSCSNPLFDSFLIPIVSLYWITHLTQSKFFIYLIFPCTFIDKNFFFLLTILLVS